MGGGDREEGVEKGGCGGREGGRRGGDEGGREGGWAIEMGAIHDMRVVDDHLLLPPHHRRPACHRPLPPPLHPRH